MKFSEEQLEQYRTEGYVIVDCPFPENLTEACMAAVEKAVQDPSEGPADGSKRNHFYLRPQVEDSYWSALDHSLPFMQIILHPEIIELARQLAEDQRYLSAQRRHQRAGPGSVGRVAHRRRSGMGGVHALLLLGRRAQTDVCASSQAVTPGRPPLSKRRPPGSGMNGESPVRRPMTAGKTSHSTTRFP